MEAELRGVERLVHVLRTRPKGAISLIQPGKKLPAPWQAVYRESPASPGEHCIDSSRPIAHERQTIAWVVLSLSIAIFSCGAVLLACSWLGQRADLTPLGTALAFVGQAGVVLGVIVYRDAQGHASATRQQTPSAV